MLLIIPFGDFLNFLYFFQFDFISIQKLLKFFLLNYIFLKIFYAEYLYNNEFIINFINFKNYILF